HWMSGYDAVWTMLEEDRTRAIAEGAPAGSTVAVADGVDIERFLPVPVSGEIEIFYVGSFRHLPNMIGFEKLRNEVMPIVWRRFGGARLRVVAGPEPGRDWGGPPALALPGSRSVGGGGELAPLAVTRGRGGPPRAL